MDGTIRFLLFWGVWLLIPVLVDGGATLASLIGGLVIRWRQRAWHRPLPYPPFISVLIPVYNAEETLEACLRSLAAQEYPQHRMEVLLVDNGSTDASFQVFARLQGELPFPVSWHRILGRGKAWALNAGIHLARGTYLIHVDADVVLAPDALWRVVEAMEAEPRLGAVTGAIHVLPPPPDASFGQRLLATCEFLEYVTAFHVGREHQTLLESLYTLSGAFSAFRREVLLRTFLYSQDTVTEDTDLTFELYERFQEIRIACVTRAVAYVHPIESLSALYAQRVRWQRGQLEVSARHPRLLRRPFWQLRGFAPSRVLLVDHTLAFPRLVWTFLMPILALFGYPARLLIWVGLGTYAFYLLVDVLWFFSAWLDVEEETRLRLQRSLWALPLLPLYRMLIFWFRFSGFLHAVAERDRAVWRVEDPLAQMRVGWMDVQRRASRGLTTLSTHLLTLLRTWLF